MCVCVCVQFEEVLIFSDAIIDHLCGKRERKKSDEEERGNWRVGERKMERKSDT